MPGSRTTTTGERAQGVGEVFGHGAVETVGVPESHDVGPVDAPAGPVVGDRGRTVDRPNLELRMERQNRLTGGRVAADHEDPLDPGALGSRDEAVGDLLVGIAG